MFKIQINRDWNALLNKKFEFIKYILIFNFYIWI